MPDYEHLSNAAEHLKNASDELGEVERETLGLLAAEVVSGILATVVQNHVDDTDEA